MLPRNAVLGRRLSTLPRGLATHAPTNQTPQSVIEKIVQRYAVDLPPNQKVQAGDYLSVRPQTVMTHDNTGPCINKVSCTSGLVTPAYPFHSPSP